MQRRVFVAAVELAIGRGDYIAIGGGEPTVHPLFWDFIGIALQSRASGDGHLWLATNGKNTKTALRLAGLARQGVLGVSLSQDSFHEAIDEKVVEAFHKPSRGYLHNCDQNPADSRDIRCVDGKVIRAGRAIKTQVWDSDHEHECICEELFVAPSGDIYQCGCQTSQFGTVFHPHLPDEYESGTCSTRNQTLTAAKEAA